MAVSAGEIHVLLVEDDKSDAYLLQAGLSESKLPRFHVEHVTRLDAAIERLRGSEAVDVIILDLNLPDSTGIDTVMSLMDLELQRPIVVITGQPDDHAMVSGLLAIGVQDYIVKGTESDQSLRRCVRNAVDRHRLLMRYRRERRKRQELAAQQEVFDETERASDILAQVNEVMCDFTKVASNELRAPLQAMSRLNKWIVNDLRHALNDEAKDKMRQFQDRIKRMEMLLDGLLAYSQAGQMVLDLVEVDVEALLGEIDAELAPPEEFSILATGKLPCFTTTQMPLQQVLRNLIDNAIKHHDQPEEGCVTISARDRDEYYEFIVADNGPGIPPQDHQRIFEIFQTNSARGQAVGSGFGLAIVKKIIDWNRGDITVDSNGSRGTTFAFTWNKAAV
ncbi:MAG: hybrid sensor histidine kinase/response regulator [Planctomycetales bacterium]